MWICYQSIVSFPMSHLRFMLKCLHDCACNHSKDHSFLQEERNHQGLYGRLELQLLVSVCEVLLVVKSQNSNDNIQP